jgi:hypothetical protein
VPSPDLYPIKYLDSRHVPGRPKGLEGRAGRSRYVPISKPREFHENVTDTPVAAPFTVTEPEGAVNDVLGALAL